jgi:2-dehydro-3-deoxygalactonokinase
MNRATEPAHAGTGDTAAAAAAAVGSIQHPRAAPRAAVLIGLDWGTTALRAYLFDAHGRVLDEHASAAGVMSVPAAAPPRMGTAAEPQRDAVREAAFNLAFDAACGAWLKQTPGLAVIAAGMVGSAQGWCETPYVETPADAAALAAHLVCLDTAGGTTVHIVPGVLQPGRLPNVMRGEETQVFGALQPANEDLRDTAPASQEIDAHNTRNAHNTHSTNHTAGVLIGLPGTHAKWVWVRGGRIEHFHTFMTGEVFAALSAHTILGRTMQTPEHADLAAFVRGVEVARDAGQAGMLATVFSTRTLGLTGQLSAQQQPDYLSGLLIGHELGGLQNVLAQRAATLAEQQPRLIGNDALCERYRLALASFGCVAVELVQHATARGLWHIAQRAGLVPAAPAAMAATANAPAMSHSPAHLRTSQE